MPDQQAGLQNGEGGNSEDFSDGVPPLLKERGTGGEGNIRYVKFNLLFL